MKKAFLMSLLSLSLGWFNASADEPAYVDMGTSVMWATENLGVDSDYPNGKCYFFGAPTAYTGAGTGASYFTSDPAAGNFYGNLEYDAVTAAYGGRWVTPTLEMFQELLNACTVKVTYEVYDEIYSRRIYEFTSKTTGEVLKFRGPGINWVSGEDDVYTDAFNVFLLTSTSVGDGLCYYIKLNDFSASFMDIEKTSYWYTGYPIRPVCLTDRNVPVASITLDKTQLTLYKGAGYEFKATVLPENATDTSIVWSSSDESVATVSQSGVVTAVALGECEITATSHDTGEVSATCKVTVTEFVHPEEQYVDMGTSVLWATENLGVCAQYPYGAYYQIGAIEPFTGEGTGASWFTDNPVTGWQNIDYAGDTNADAATVALGEGWSTPTRAQINELASACSASCEKDDASGRYILTLTSRTTGNKLQFYYAGYMTNSKDYSDLDYLTLLSSTVQPERNGYLVKTQAPYTTLTPAYSFMAASGNNYYNLRPVKEKPAAPDSVVIDNRSISVVVDGTQQLVATVYPENAKQSVVWSSSDEEVATVDEKGLVTGVAVGTCVITAETTDGSGVKDECQVEVYKMQEEEGMTFVDMGTSVLWASQTLGVDEEHPYGNHYKFGATSPYPTVSPFATQSPKTAEWGGDPEYDAATALLGKGVSTPSKAQFEELFAVCDYKVGRNYELGRDQITLTSKITGNKLVITGAGYWSFSNDYTSSADLFLLTSSAREAGSTALYYFSAQAASSKGLENSISVNSGYAPYLAYQILPVFNADETVKATSISLNASTLSLAVGDEATLSATIEPQDVSVTDVKWTTSDESVAEVDANGNVTALAEGVATVTVTTTDGSKLSASCEVTVKAATVGMNYVDLGLSVLWGECEIGASDFTQAGTYYAWGTVENANNWEAAVESAYTPQNTTTAVTAVSRDEADATKAYDVAKEVLGDQWHTPNLDEWNEMLENCDMTYNNVNNQRHITFTSKINGNSITFTGHGYMRETSSSPLMSTSVILQTSDGANSNIFTAIYMVPPRVDGLARYCYWLVPIRPVYGDHLAAIGSVSADSRRDGLFDVYDISGRQVLRAVEYGDACSKLNSGVYIFVNPDGRRLKVSL